MNREIRRLEGLIREKKERLSHNWNSTLAAQIAQLEKDLEAAQRTYELNEAERAQAAKRANE